MELISRIKSNGVKRTITGLSLVAYLFLAMYIGAPAIYFNTLAIQLKCFDEVIQIAYKIKKFPDDSNFCKMNWYLLFTANYYFTGDIFFAHLKPYCSRYHILHILNHYHKFISFCLYLLGLLWFSTLVRKKLMRQQFSLLFWTHFLILIIVWQSYMAIYNLFEGIIWVVLPLGLVILNDVFSYIFGKFYGKTPLIRLSPKKTWEGFIMGGVSTVLLGLLLSHLLSKIQYLICPWEYKEIDGVIGLSTNCTPSYTFQLQEYYIFNTNYSIAMYPLFLDSLALSVFASIIAPFGGFFASGFKRAVGVKDFGDVIPGHGGLMDRFDCQFLMATFSRVYIKTFIKPASVDRLFQRVLCLSDEKQLQFFHLLQDSLKELGLE